MSSKIDSLKIKLKNGLAIDSLKLFDLKLKFLKKNAHASYYANKFNGRRTASGKSFNNNGYTAAHKKLPFGTKVKVTNETNGKSVIVEISNNPEFKVRVYPNPFANQFRINIESSSDENLSIRIFDVLGQLIEKQGNIAYSTDVTIGSNLARGVYILEVSQGDKVDLIRIVKSE